MKKAIRLINVCSAVLLLCGTLSSRVDGAALASTSASNQILAAAEEMPTSGTLSTAPDLGGEPADAPEADLFVPEPTTAFLGLLATLFLLRRRKP